jgi:hypothetical protein
MTPPDVRNCRPVLNDQAAQKSPRRSRFAAKAGSMPNASVGIQDSPFVIDTVFDSFRPGLH